MAKVSKWKEDERKRFGKLNGGIVGLTVGDQWSDIVLMKSDEDFEKVDAKFPSPWTIVRTNDKISIWGLKLRDRRR